METPSSLFIDGKWSASAEGSTRQVINPANNQMVDTVSEAGVKDAERAIGAARKAFDEGPWPQMRGLERASYLFKLADKIDAIADELATLETKNNGKPLREAKYDIADAANCFRYYAGLVTKPTGQ